MKKITQSFIVVMLSMFGFCLQAAADDIVIDFNSMSLATSSSDNNDGDILEPYVMVFDGGTLTVSPADEGVSNPNRFWGTNNGPQLRCYSGTITIEAESTMKSIVFDVNNNKFNLTPDVGEIAETTWSGEATKVVFTVNGNTQINKITISSETSDIPATPEAADIAAFKALEKGTEAKLILTDAYVTAISGSNAYVQDASGALYFYNSGLALEAGKKLNGSVIGKLDIYNSLPEFTKTANTNGDEITATEGTATPKNVTVAEALAAENVSMLVKVTASIVEEDGKYYAVDGENKIQIYDQFKVMAEGFAYPETADIVAIVGMYKGTPQLYPLDANSITEPVTVNPDDPELVAPEGWENMITNGNLAGDDVTSFVAKEYPATSPVGATIVAGAGKNNSRGVVVKSQDKVSQPWDSQFWINMSETLPAGTKVHVEFDYKADKAGSVGTQSHAAPGAYLHWAAIGNVAFTTEWQHFSNDFEVASEAANMQSIAFNLNDIAEANTFYFDNFGVWVQKPAPVENWVDLIVNGDMEGESTECFYVTEQGVGGPFLAVTTAGKGKDGSKAIKVQSADEPANDWATQFFVRLPYELPAGTKFKFSFDYKADVEGGADTQCHNEPGQYIHYTCAGSPNFTTEWQHYEAEGSVPSQCNGGDNDGGYKNNFQTIAFNLAKNKVATEFIFDNVKFEVPEDVVATLTEDPAENPVPYPASKEDDELVAPDGWTSVITNGNLAGDDVTSYVSKEAPSADILPAAIVAGAGKNEGRGIVVKSADNPAQAWDTQFWIKMNEPLADGTKLHVEFDFAANKAAAAQTQAHGDPGAYKQHGILGDVNFTEEWQHFSKEVVVSGEAADMQSIAFNLAVEKTATEYYFDNFGVWIQKPAPVEEWADIIVNGDMEGDDTQCFYVTEQGIGGPFVAATTAGKGKDGGKAIALNSADSPAQDWDTQFFIRLPYQIPAGTKYKVSFDYKADKAGDFDTQAHAEPGDYIFYQCIGSGSFTTEWQTYEKEGTVSTSMSSEDKPMQTIAFNLAKNKAATEFIFDNVKFEIEKSVADALTPNPAENPNAYPLLPEGPVYFQDVASGKFLAAGHDWGTRAIVNADGLDFTATAADGKYTLDSQVSNGGDSHFLGSNLYTDAAAFGWTIARAGKGVITISNGTQFVGVDADDNAAWSDEPVQWKALSYADRVNALKDASADAPANATFLVKDANFNRNDLRKSAWTGDDFGVGGDNTNMNAEKWGGNSQTFDISQTVDAPNGLYAITWNGFYRYNNTEENTNDVAVAAHADGTEVINSFVYLNDADYALTSIADEAAAAVLASLPFSQGEASAAFGQGLYEQTAKVVVADGKLTIGIKKTDHPGTDWTVWDNFRLSYLGEVAEQELAEAPEGWHSVIANGNLGGEEVANFFTKENGGDPTPAVIVAGAGKDYSRGIVINTNDNPANDWEAQFFIQANETIGAGYKIHVEFDYMATQEAGFDTQSHAAPGDYIHWYCVDSYTAKPEWQHVSKEVEVSAADASGNGEWGKACTNEAGGKPFQTVAFNLSKVKTATTFYFDNIVFWVSDVDTGVKEIKALATDRQEIYNLSGQKVNNPTKGLYIINGKKVLVK